jgi:hypothetical protein
VIALKTSEVNHQDLKQADFIIDDFTEVQGLIEKMI